MFLEIEANAEHKTCNVCTTRSISFFYRSIPKPVANGNVLHITDDKPSPDENKVGYYDLSPRGTDIDLSPQGTDYILSSGGGGTEYELPLLGTDSILSHELFAAC